MELSKAEVSRHKVFWGSEANQGSRWPGRWLSMTSDEPTDGQQHTPALWRRGGGMLVRPPASCRASDGRPVWVPPEADAEKEIFMRGVGL